MYLPLELNTPALVGGRIYLRTSEALYCFGRGRRD